MHSVDLLLSSDKRMLKLLFNSVEVKQNFYAKLNGLIGGSLPASNTDKVAPPETIIPAQPSPEVTKIVKPVQKSISNKNVNTPPKVPPRKPSLISKTRSATTIDRPDTGEQEPPKQPLVVNGSPQQSATISVGRRQSIGVGQYPKRAPPAPPPRGNQLKSTAQLGDSQEFISEKLIEEVVRGTEFGSRIKFRSPTFSLIKPIAKVSRVQSEQTM